MRSFDRAMPEELNRVLTDHASDLLLCSSEVSASNLASESVAGHVAIVGDVMVDVARAVQPRACERTDLVAAHGVEPGEYALVTAHRAGNVDGVARLERLVAVLESVPIAVVFPVHPRTRERLAASGLDQRLNAAAHVRMTPPLGYVELTALLCSARAVLTDSGGLQKEAYFAGVPCVTLRPSTEWTETVDAGWNSLVDLDPQRVAAALAKPMPPAHPELYGDGRAGERVVAALRLRYA